MWQSPWDNAVRGGDQVAQAVWALATGGVFGTGLRARRHALSAGRAHRSRAGRARRGAGARRASSRCGVLYAAIAWRGFRIGLRAASDYGVLPRHRGDAVPVVPVLVMARRHPRRDAAHRRRHAVSELRRIGDGRQLRGARHPHVDRRASRRPRGRRAVPRADALSARAALGVRGAGARRRPARRAARARRRLRRRPHLSLQADGVRALSVQPARARLVARAAARQRLRSRAACVLATGDAELARAGAHDVPEARRDAERHLRRAGGALLSARRRRPSTCSATRGTRENWSASNSSYVERDADDRLRGFDDHATAVQSADDAGPAGADRPARLPRAGAAAAPPARAGSSGGARVPRPQRATCASTIDARLQLRRRRDPAHRRAAIGDAAAPRPSCSMPTTGEVLGARQLSVPGRRSPGTRGRAKARRGAARSRALRAVSARIDVQAGDRGRGAAAESGAQRRRRSPARACPTAASAPHSRLGGRCATTCWTQHPHGTIAMHDGLVHSCNAYFAQLALKLGPEACWIRPPRSASP